MSVPWAALALSAVGFAVLGLSRLRWPTGRRQTHGRSRWATLRELRDLSGTVGGPPLGWYGRHLLRLPDEDNLLVFGVQRSGKTSTLVVPSLLDWPGAAVATSTKDELVRLTAAARGRRGPVSVFAPLDEDRSWVGELGLQAVRWNPLEECTGAGRAAELADFFTAEGKSSGSAHWYLSAANLLTGLFLVKHAEGADLRNVLSHLNQTHLAGYAGAGIKGGPAAQEILKSIAITPEKEAGSIISTARSSLSLWLDERVAEATAAAGLQALELDELLARGGTLYLVAPAEEAARCKPLFSALLGALLRRATSAARHQGGVLTPRLLLALDEIANFASIPRLPGYVSTGPGQGIQLLLAFHDLAQLEEAYGTREARTVWNNCRARVLLPGQGDLRTLNLFSEAIGNETVLYEQSAWGAHGASRSEQRTGRRLADADDLRRSGESVLLYGNRAPIKLKSRRWDQVLAWRDQVRPLVRAS